jgi:hypothetical protein
MMNFLSLNANYLYQLIQDLFKFFYGKLFDPEFHLIMCASLKNQTMKAQLLADVVTNSTIDYYKNTLEHLAVEKRGVMIKEISVLIAPFVKIAVDEQQSQDRCEKFYRKWGFDDLQEVIIGACIIAGGNFLFRKLLKADDEPGE